jgi:hypothetical protein
MHPLPFLTVLRDFARPLKAVASLQSAHSLPAFRGARAFANRLGALCGTTVKDAEINDNVIRGRARYYVAIKDGMFVCRFGYICLGALSRCGRGLSLSAANDGQVRTVWQRCSRPKR